MDLWQLLRQANQQQSALEGPSLESTGLGGHTSPQPGAHSTSAASSRHKGGGFLCTCLHGRVWGLQQHPQVDGHDVLHVEAVLVHLVPVGRGGVLRCGVWGWGWGGGWGGSRWGSCLIAHCAMHNANCTGRQPPSKGLEPRCTGAATLAAGFGMPAGCGSQRSRAEAGRQNDLMPRGRYSSVAGQRIQSLQGREARAAGNERGDDKQVGVQRCVNLQHGMLVCGGQAACNWFGESWAQ